MVLACSTDQQHLTSCMHKIPRKHSQQLTGDGDGAQENISTLQTTADAALALAHGQRSLQGVACVRPNNAQISQEPRKRFWRMRRLDAP